YGAVGDPRASHAGHLGGATRVAGPDDLETTADRCRRESLKVPPSTLSGRRSSNRHVMLTNLVREVRFSFRSLLKDRGFAMTAVLSIGLGVGANAAIFSLVSQALFRLLPVHERERLVLMNWRGAFVG